MKTIYFIFVITLTLFVVQISVSYGYDRVCIDPGHGGPGASKYGCNGWGYNAPYGYPMGAAGPVYDLTEQWVNLQVGLKLEYMVDVFAWPENAIITRWEDTLDLSLEDRADRANKANGGEGVDQFISVHHNGLPLNKQGIETWWCAAETTDSNWARDTTNLLAKKIRWRLRDMWHYCSRCERDPDNCDPIVNMNCEDCVNKKVLRLVKMAAVLTEASNLYNAHEESLFNDPSMAHIDSEAEAIYHGWHSFLMNAGVVTVTYAYEGGYGGKVVIDDDTITTPFYTCWEFPEDHRLECKGSFDYAGHTYTFNHWNHDWILPHDPDYCWWEPHYDTTWYISVPAEYDHNYYAYMAGGPYSVSVIFPNGYEIWHIGEQRYIHWSASPGADSSSQVDIYLSRDGGTNWVLIMPDLDYDFDNGGYYLWTVTGPASTHCQIKITANDCAENTAFDISNKDFIIGTEGNNNPVIDSHIHCKYPEDECEDCIQYGEQVTIEIFAHDPDGDSMYYEWFCMHGHFAENGQNTITTAENSVTYVAPTKGKAESPALRSEPSGSKTNGEEGEETLFDDYISVEVTDVRGGHSFTVGWPELHDPEYPCICGDVTDDGIPDIGDVTFLLNYLYKYGTPAWDSIPPPQERADVNCDAEISIGDVVHLLNFLFRLGQPEWAPLECGWFPPE